MADGSKIRLTIPRQDLARFPLFALTATGAQQWVESLPAVNTNTSAQLLAQALGELNRSALAPELRFEILEIIRPNLEVALVSLAKRYLKQPLVMPEEPGRMAALAEELLATASTAYTVVAVETIQQHDAIARTNPARLVCRAIQGALHYAGQRLLQSLQLYKPLPIHGWHSMHQLYALAEDQQLAELPLQDIGPGNKDIKSTYLQVLVLSCCKPNQLRQSDLARIHQALYRWSEKVELLASEEEQGLFLVNLASDQPPLYSSLWPDSSAPTFRRINTESLVAFLKDLKPSEAENEQAPSDVTLLPPHLIEHLIKSLGQMSLRNFARTPSTSSLRVSLGLSSTHYHVAGRVNFETLIDEDGEPDAAAGQRMFPSPDKADVWQDTPQEREYVKNEWLPGQETSGDTNYGAELDERTQTELLEEVEIQLPLDQRYPVHKVQLVDASPGGYCLEWNEELPGDVHTGDIVSLKEESGESWVIAVIRWLSRLESSRTLIGLELLSPRAMAFGAQVQNSTGELSSPMRVLLLPEIKLVGQSPTLITPVTSFRERQRITLLNHRDRQRVQLLRRISSTASYAQFEFEYVEELGDVLARNQRNTLTTPYDSLWSNI